MHRHVLLGWIALAALAGCSRTHAGPSPVAEPAMEAGAGVTTTTTEGEVADADGGAPAEPEPTGPMLYAFAPVAPIFSAPEWPAKDPQHAADDRKGVVRLGYFRPGERVAIKPGEPSKKNCLEGWYELVQGGFVCGKYATPDRNGKELRNAPHAPWMDKILPYDYGLNLTPGTPLYRRVPKKAERKEYEKTLAIGKGKKASDVAKQLAASGEAVPSYLKNVDEAKPKVAFDDLKGESDLIVTRMLRGFYLSLDKPMDVWSGSFWRTADGFVVPKDHIKVHDTKTEFEGVELQKPGQTIRIPFAYVVGTRGHEYTFDGDDPKRGDKLDRFTIANLTGQRKTSDNKVYHETDQGYWLRGIDIAVVKQPKPPSDLAAGEKWIDVDLRDQSLVAMEGDKPVYATIVSTGRRSDEPDKDHRTVEGSFRIREKHVTVTMDDDGASDGTYRIQDVPWVMYFEKGYALHGAFWHAAFGREKSHGCVNLQPFDAKRLFEWAGPKLPEGWHGVVANKENPGTRVVTHR